MMPVGLPITISDDNQYRDELKKYFQKYNDWVAEVLDEKMNSSLRLAKMVSPICLYQPAQSSFSAKSGQGCPS